MKAITVRQPWAWAIFHGGKDVENRTRNIAGGYRGPVAIHAAKGWAAAAVAFLRLLGIEPPSFLVRGAIIGVVELVGVHPDCTELVPGYGETPTCSAWAMSDHYHLDLANPRPLAEPIPWRGQLGLWNLPDDVLAGAQ